MQVFKICGTAAVQSWVTTQQITRFLILLKQQHIFAKMSGIFAIKT